MGKVNSTEPQGSDVYGDGPAGSGFPTLSLGPCFWHEAQRRETQMLIMQAIAGAACFVTGLINSELGEGWFNVLIGLAIMIGILQAIMVGRLYNFGELAGGLDHVTHGIAQPPRERIPVVMPDDTAGEMWLKLEHLVHDGPAVATWNDVRNDIWLDIIVELVDANTIEVRSYKRGSPFLAKTWKRGEQDYWTQRLMQMWFGQP